MAGRTLAILGLMQYLSERLLATETARSRGEGEGQREVANQQRQRILAATERLMAERGCAGTTIEGIAKQARVSSVTFYDHFASKEEAFVASFERAVEEGRALLADEVPPDLPWPEQVREGLQALLGTIAANPERAKMVLVESQRGARALLGRHEAVLDSAVPKLREGRRLAAPEELPETLEEATVAGVAWLLRERLESTGAEGIEELLSRLLDVVLGPYLGSAEALRLTVARGEGSGG
ncbi:MAG: transcriptional regulator, TetR family [Solirubrobacterales bacterium]|nr:transcriptional regulator, TetR family [Solirubrobacterales bacterium]